MIESAAQPRTHIEAPPEDRAKHAAPDAAAPVIFRADNNARWLIKATKARKAKRVLLGLINRGSRIKFILALPMLARTHRFGAMIKGRNAQRVLADKAYASKANHAALRGKHRGGILQKTVRG